MKLSALIKSIQTHETAILWMVGVSTITFIATLIAVPWAIVRIPSDYFARRKRLRKQSSHRHPIVRWVLLIGKNLLGLVLMAAGFVMLVLPGQGMLTILLGIVLMDVPGKYRLERWIVAHRPVLQSINWFRQRAGQPPLVFEE